MNLEKIDSLVLLQRQILAVAAQYVRAGGSLIYSTCTIDRQENEENVTWFLQEQPDYSLEGMEQILPDTSGNDGFFIAKLRKQ